MPEKYASTSSAAETTANVKNAETPHIVSVQVGGKHDFSKAATEAIRLIENYGVEGDAHAGATDQHLYHIRRFGSHPNLRQVHLIQAEFFDQVFAHGHAVGPGDLGENIATRHIDLLHLPTGTRLGLGPEAVIELTGLRNPCHQIDTFQSGLLKHCKTVTPDGAVARKAGVMSIVLQGGIVRPGDVIGVELPAEPHVPLVYRVPDMGDVRTSFIRHYLRAVGFGGQGSRSAVNREMMDFFAKMTILYKRWQSATYAK